MNFNAENKIKVMLLVKPRETIFMYRTLEMICNDKTLGICAVLVDEGKLELRKEVKRYYKKRGLLRSLIKAVTFSLPSNIGRRLEFEGTGRVHHCLPVRGLNIGDDAVWIHTADPYTSAIISKLRELKPDIAFRASGFGIVKAPLLSIPKHGILSYHHGDLTRYRGGPPCVWEIYNNESEVGATVQILAEGLDKGAILMQKFYKIDYNISINEFVDRVKLESADLAYEAIKKSQRGEFQPREPATVGKLYTSPTAAQLAKLHVKNMGNIIRGFARRFVKAG